MGKVFGYPPFDANGEKILTTYTNEYADMMMDIRVYQMKAGDIKEFQKAEEETAVLLLKGSVIMTSEDSSITCSRKDVFTEGPYCIHVCAGIAVTVEANTDVEILVQSTKNKTEFATKIYKPEDAPFKYSCLGKFGNTAKRRVNTILDADIAPYSNMVLGEVLNDPGNWSGYLPH